ncbi:MAG: hypothetical protein QGH60_11780, partial [Phycisphaerae bacterium]|nr:hypothetical protein [Phycisphaerae bacterium]
LRLYHNQIAISSFAYRLKTLFQGRLSTPPDEPVEKSKDRRRDLQQTKNHQDNTVAPRHVKAVLPMYIGTLQITPDYCPGVGALVVMTLPTAKHQLPTAKPFTYATSGPGY